MMLVVERPIFTGARSLSARAVSPAGRARKPPLRVALEKLSRNDHAYVVGIPDKEGAMCRRSEYDLYARTRSKLASTNSKPARSLVEVLRDLLSVVRMNGTGEAVIEWRLWLILGC
jgi:hypothetical protein